MNGQVSESCDRGQLKNFIEVSNVVYVKVEGSKLLEPLKILC